MVPRPRVGLKPLQLGLGISPGFQETGRRCSGFYKRGPAQIGPPLAQTHQAGRPAAIWFSQGGNGACLASLDSTPPDQ